MTTVANKGRTTPEPPSGGGGDVAVTGGPITVMISGHTDVGNERDLNEDNFLIADLTVRARNLDEETRTVGPKGIVLAVCDGMGGAAAGEVASDLAVETLYSSLIASTAGKTALSKDDLADSLEGGALRGSSRIHDESLQDLSKAGMGTTLTAAALADRHLVFAQVGDSRGYILRNGRLTQITRDQSLVAKLVEQGKLPPEQADTYEHSNIILQALGATSSVIVECTYVELGRGDRLLLCSDGLHGLVPYEEIQTFMACGATPNQICIELIERAKELGGHDNVTAVVAFFEGVGLHADIGSVVVNARGGGTDLFEIPDPKQLADLMGAGGGAMSGTAVLSAVAPNATSSPPPPPEPVPQMPVGSDPSFPKLPDSPSIASLMEDALKSASTPAPAMAKTKSVPPSFPLPAVARSLVPATQTQDDDEDFKPIESIPKIETPPQAGGGAVQARSQQAALVGGGGSAGSRSWLIAAVLLVLALAGGAALYVITERSAAKSAASSSNTAATSTTTAGAGGASANNGSWTAVDAPSSTSSSNNNNSSTTTPQAVPRTTAGAAKGEPKAHPDGPKTGAAAGAATARPTAATATAAAKKSDLAPLKDDE